MACVIMHNMIIKSERANPVRDDQPFEHQGPLAHIDHEQVPANFSAFLAMQNEIVDEEMHFQAGRSCGAFVEPQRATINLDLVI